MAAKWSMRTRRTEVRFDLDVVLGTQEMKTNVSLTLVRLAASAGSRICSPPLMTRSSTTGTRTLIGAAESDLTVSFSFGCGNSCPVVVRRLIRSGNLRAEFILRAARRATMLLCVRLGRMHGGGGPR